MLGEADEAIQEMDHALSHRNLPEGTNAAQPSAEALSDETVKKLVDAYLKSRRRASRCQSRDQTRQSGTTGTSNTLMKWERSSGDFKSAVELNQKDEDARYKCRRGGPQHRKTDHQIKQLEQIAMNLGMKQAAARRKAQTMPGQITRRKCRPARRATIGG